MLVNEHLWGKTSLDLKQPALWAMGVCKAVGVALQKRGEVMDPERGPESSSGHMGACYISEHFWQGVLGFAFCEAPSVCLSNIKQWGIDTLGGWTWDTKFICMGKHRAKQTSRSVVAWTYSKVNELWPLDSNCVAMSQLMPLCTTVSSCLPLAWERWLTVAVGWLP